METEYTKGQKDILFTYFEQNQGDTDFEKYLEAQGHKNNFSEQQIIDINMSKPYIDSLKTKEKVVNQHYVPQFYLKKFTNDEGRIETYSMKHKKIMKAQNPEHMCSDDFFYSSQNGEDTIIAQVIEDILRQYECIFSDSYDSILEDILAYGKIKNENMYDLCSFVAVSRMRTKAFRDEINRSRTTMMKEISARWYSMLKDIDPNHPQVKAIQNADSESMIINQEYDMEHNNVPHLQFLMDTQQISGYTNRLSHKRVRIYIAKGSRSFVTSDNCVLEAIPENAGMYDRHFCDRIHYFVFSPKILIEFSSPQLPGKQIKRSAVGDSEVLYFNLLRSRQSYQLYSHSKDNFIQEEYDRARTENLDKLVELFPSVFLEDRKLIDEQEFKTLYLRTREIFEDPASVRELGNISLKRLLVKVLFGEEFFYTKNEGFKTPHFSVLYTISGLLNGSQITSGAGDETRTRNSLLGRQIL